MHEMTPRLDRYENQKAKFQKAEKTLEHTNQVETENLVLKIKLHEFETSKGKLDGTTLMNILDLFFEIFLDLEISAKKNTAF